MTDPATTEAVDEAAARLGAPARRDVPPGPLTTYRVGGPAALLVEVADEADLDEVADAVVASQVPTLVVGRGSNLLVPAAGFAGLALVLGEAFADVELHGSTVHAGAAASLPVTARRTAKAGLTGFEWAVGVPGSVGGAVRMNAGGHGSDMAGATRRVRVRDLAGGDDGTVSADELRFGYPRSSIGPTQVVLGVELHLAEGDRAVAEARLSEIVRWRRAHQPGGPNAGSVFTNPPDDSAGRLVEEPGAKGLRVGSAAVSTKHANFIQADEGGLADDVVAVMVALRRRVAEVTGVTLVPETRLVGFNPRSLVEVEG